MPIAMHNDQIKRRKNEELTLLTVLRDSDRKFRLKLGFSFAFDNVTYRNSIVGIELL